MRKVIAQDTQLLNKINNNMKHIQTFEIINEAKFKFSEKEVKDAAETLAKAMAKLDKVKVEIHDFEYDKLRGADFELSWDGEDYVGGSYYIKANGDVINAAVDGGTKYGTIKSSEKDFIKGIKSSKFNMRTDESMLNEGGMSDMYLLAQEAKDEASFLKEFFKDFGDKVKKTSASVKWAKSIYSDSMEMALESAIQEGTLIDLRLVNENVEDDIEAALTNWLNTLADGNAVAMSDLYLENGVLLGTLAKEIKQGREQLQEYFEMFLKKSPIGSVDSFILQNFGDVCISDGTYTFEIDSEGGNRESIAARYTYVWKKENKKWMIATHHSSVNP
jgi:uncharacterized protein (TIGR02246 family)